MLNFNANQDKISLSPLKTDLASVDVFFDENRVWSIDVRNVTQLNEKWPEALKPYLKGSTSVKVRDSSSFELLAEKEITFTADKTRTVVADSAGVPLSINKWGRLGRSLDAIGSDIQEAILDRSEEIIKVLADMQLKPFVVGGTLLGGVRDGALLPHDDDADIAYFSEHESPVDVAVEGYRVGRKLEDLGYKVMRHSATHMQIHFEHEKTGAPYYVDVFAAFFTADGHINQPFHVRGEMHVDDMFPFSSVEISGRPFPAPANPEAWLVINYDAQWRTPIPGYVITTPLETRRRFENWFGTFNNMRHFWNDFFEKNSAPNPVWAAGALWFENAMKLVTSPQLLEVGCGANPISFNLSSLHEEYIATDFAELPLQLAEQKTGPGKRTAHLNLLRLNTVTAPERLGIDGPFDLLANHVLDQVHPEAREGLYRLARMALLSDGSAAATFFSKPDPGVNPDDPTLWHLTKTQVAAEAEKFGMGVLFENVPAHDSYVANRKPVAVVFSLKKGALSLTEEEISVKQQISAFLDKFSPTKSQRELRVLREQVETLQSELDEFRNLSSRIAQLTDILERQVENKSSDE